MKGLAFFLLHKLLYVIVKCNTTYYKWCSTFFCYGNYYMSSCNVTPHTLLNFFVAENNSDVRHDGLSPSDLKTLFQPS